MWHPQGGGLAQLDGEGKVAVFPAIGYDPPDESHFTSRHYWEVGELNTQARSGWMGRYLDVAGSAGNPLQGLSLDYSLAPALATTGCRWPRSPRRRTTTSGPTASTNRSTAPGDGRVRRARRAVGALARARPGARRGAGHRTSSAPDRAVRRTRRETRLHLARHLPDHGRGLPDSASRCSRR